jgi:hypothetical protein
MEDTTSLQTCQKKAPKLQYLVQSMNTVELQKCLHRMMSYHYSHRCWCLTLSVPADHTVIGTQPTIETLRFVNLLQLKFAVNTKYSSFINGRLNIVTKCSIVNVYNNYYAMA